MDKRYLWEHPEIDLCEEKIWQQSTCYHNCNPSVNESCCPNCFLNQNDLAAPVANLSPEQVATIKGYEKDFAAKFAPVILIAHLPKNKYPPTSLKPQKKKH